MSIDAKISGLLGIGSFLLIILIGSALMEGEYFVNLLILIEAPWSWIYNALFPLLKGDEPDRLGIGGGIILLIGPFLSLIISYLIGYSIIKLISKRT